ncbi:MAG: hypothetical protein KF817_14695 [Phycisphaeraceae bacterium]|nr:hypothetical protein [Phycisphaeraceae bacterium]
MSAGVRFAGCVVALTLAGMAGMASAQSDRVSASEKGSLLVWSKVEVVLAQPMPASTVVTIPVDEVFSNFGLGNAGNEHIVTDLAAAAGGIPGSAVTITGIGWDLNIETFGASWRSEARIAFMDNLGSPPATTLAPGVADNSPSPPGGTDYSSNGIVVLADVFQPDILLADGVLDLEFFESFVDDANGPDAVLNGTIDVQVNSMPPGDPTLVQDTIISLTNDFPEDVAFQMYFIQGDNTNPLGYWQVSDVGIELTRDQPVYWSAATGLGTVNVTPWTVLGPGIQDGNTTIYRGMIVGWAVDRVTNRPIRHNHLAGQGTVVNYADASAYEYSTWAFAANQGTQGQPLPIAPGPDGSIAMTLGTDYAPSYAQLLLNFQATGAGAWSSPGSMVVSDTSVTLHPMDWDLRENAGAPPVITKAQYDVWNENEVKFSGAYRCIICWDQTLLSGYGLPNHFGVGTLQTNHGKARIDGVASPLCDHFNSGPPILSVATSLLGIGVRHLSIDSEYATAASSLVGMGQENAVIRYFPGSGPPDESPQSGSPVVSFDRMMKSITTR